MSLLLTIALLIFASVGFELGRRRAHAVAGGDLPGLHSRPGYHGAYVALWCALPALAVLVVWFAAGDRVVEGAVAAMLPVEVAGMPAERLELFLRDARSLAHGDIPSGAVGGSLRSAGDRWLHLETLIARGVSVVVVLLAAAGLLLARSRVRKELRARIRVEKVIRASMILCSIVAILTTIGIVLSLVFESARFFALVPPTEFLFGTEWSPQTAIRADQVGSTGTFGAIPIFVGTMLITFLAMGVAVPVGLLAAIYLSEYANDRARSLLKPVLEILAGVPSVVYGFFAALSVAPLVRRVGTQLGLDVASESALAAGLVMGVMIIPFVSSLSDDVIRAVPRSLREGSLGLGATSSETIRRVVLPAAFPGIVAAILLAMSRAIGETMIVVMAAGLAANLSLNPLEAVTTVTVQIVTLLVGDQEFDSAKTLAAFALGLVLFVVTLGLNMIALYVVRSYREKYD